MKCIKVYSKINHTKFYKEFKKEGKTMKYTVIENLHNSHLGTYSIAQWQGSKLFEIGEFFTDFSKAVSYIKYLNNAN